MQKLRKKTLEKNEKTGRISNAEQQENMKTGKITEMTNVKEK